MTDLLTEVFSPARSYSLVNDMHKMTEKRKEFVIQNFAYRLSLKHPSCAESIGAGAINPDIVVVHPENHFASKDPVTGALRKFNLLDVSFRTTSSLVPDRGYKTNNYFLVELIELLDPKLVILCGPEALSACRGTAVRNYKKYQGNLVDIPRFGGIKLYCAINPFSYGGSSGSTSMKQAGQQDWKNIAAIYNSVLSQQNAEL